MKLYFHSSVHTFISHAGYPPNPSTSFSVTMLSESNHLHRREGGRHLRKAFNVTEINSDTVVGLGSHRPPGYELRGYGSKNTQDSQVAFKRLFDGVTRLSGQASEQVRVWIWQLCHRYICSNI